MAASEALKLARLAARQASQDRIFELLKDPAVEGLAVALGGMYVAQRIRWVEDDSANEDLRALATAAAVLIGTSRAGLSGTASAVLAGGAAIAGSGEVVANLSGSKGFWNFLLGSDRRLWGLAIPGITK